MENSIWTQRLHECRPLPYQQWNAMPLQVLLMYAKRAARERGCPLRKTLNDVAHRPLMARELPSPAVDPDPMYSLLHSGR